MLSGKMMVGMLIGLIYVGLVVAMVYAEVFVHLRVFYAVCGLIGVGFYLSTTKVLSVLRKEEGK